MLNNEAAKVMYAVGMATGFQREYGKTPVKILPFSGLSG
jgi:hypothetical protein